jgi:hypothetical protein
LIEFQGPHHYYAIEIFGGEDNLRDIQRRDAIKAEYAKKQGFTLIYIPYWEFDNIEKILRNQIGINGHKG